MSCKIPLWAANIEVGGMRMKRNAMYVLIGVIYGIPS